MPLDEELDGNEMRVLIVNRAAIIAHATFGQNPLTKEQLIESATRILQFAESLPPDVKQ